MPNGFTTELAAVNIILQMLDEEPINSLGGEQPLEVTQAQNSLEEVSREIQSQGWHFNTEYKYPLTPNADGEIILPQSTLECDIDHLFNSSAGLTDYIQRGVRLYDRENRTYNIGKELNATMVNFLPWDDLPEPFRRWIFVKAGRTLYNRAIGDSATDQKLAREEVQAKATAENFNARTADKTIFDNDVGYNILNRRMRRRSRNSQFG
jgi:hypothetical protein